MRRSLQRRRHVAGFTLVELLVVVTVLGLLIAILMPGLRGAKRVSKRVVCGTRLHAIGLALRMYLADSNDYLPVVEYLPSNPMHDDHPKRSISEVLLPYIHKNVVPTPASDDDPGGEEDESPPASDEVFQCPADLPGRDRREGDKRGKSYFQTEGSSYVFNVRLQFLRDGTSFLDDAFDEPVKLSEIVRTERAKRRFGGVAAEEQIWLLRDYIAFHGKSGQPGSTNYLYVDGHVSDLER